MPHLPRAAGPAADPRVIAVAAGKGGAGASTVAALLACTSAAEGVRTLLVEAFAPATLHLLFEQDEAAAVPRIVSDRLVLLSASADLPGPGDTAAQRAHVRASRDAFGAFDRIIVDVGTRLDAVLAARDVGAATLLIVTPVDRIGLAASHALIKVAVANEAAADICVVANRCDGALGDQALAVLADGVRHFLGRTFTAAGALPDQLLANVTGTVPLHRLHAAHPLMRAAAVTLEQTVPDDLHRSRMIGVLP